MKVAWVLFAAALCGLLYGAAHASETPQIKELIPASGLAGAAYPIRITIVGAGFMPTGNTIDIGPVKLTDVASTDSTSISIQLPKVLLNTGQAPPLVLQPGEYLITVTTQKGTSNSMPFRLTH